LGWVPESHEVTAEMKLPTLYAKSSQGKTKCWEVEVKTSPVHLVISHGYEGGKMTEERRPVVGKNEGRANATTDYQQACLEAKARWTKQKDKSYREEGEETPITTLPMLAKDYKKYKHKVSFPCYVQPKLNGVRALVSRDKSGAICFMSRGGKEYTTLGHLHSYFQNLECGVTLDGEIYCHGMDLQDISAATKKFDPVNTPRLEYWIYDKVDTEVPFEQRFPRVSSWDSHNPVTVVATGEVFCSEDVEVFMKKCLGRGFEGVIIRNKEGKYTPGHRSSDLLKYKEFQDDEFLIVGHEQDVHGRVIWSCSTDNGEFFNVVPRGTDEQRKQWLAEYHKFIGRKLTVRYLELSKAGVPIGNPVGICIRDYE
jgi:DNA ligase 1